MMRCVCIGGPADGQEINVRDGCDRVEFPYFVEPIEVKRAFPITYEPRVMGKARYERFGDVLLMISGK